MGDLWDRVDELTSWTQPDYATNDIIISVTAPQAIQMLCDAIIKRDPAAVIKARDFLISQTSETI